MVYTSKQVLGVAAQSYDTCYLVDSSTASSAPAAGAPAYNEYKPFTYLVPLVPRIQETLMLMHRSTGHVKIYTGTKKARLIFSYQNKKFRGQHTGVSLRTNPLL